jgi:hypothetical protein
MSKDESNIALIGDSILDNFYWLTNNKQDLRQELNNLFALGSVHNFAVDESTIIDVMQGCKPKLQYVMGRKRFFNDNYPYPIDSSSGLVKPLDLLSKHSTDYVVLSIGGNDGRKHLSKLLWSSDSVVEAILADGFIDDIDTLLYCISQIQSRIIIVIPYKPHKTIFEHYRSSFGSWFLSSVPVENWIDLSGRLDKVYDRLRSVYIEMAMKYNIPIIDLSRTFDHDNKDHYGITPIEPSNLSSRCIAQLIKHIVYEHNFNGPPRVYYANECDINNLKTTQLIRKVT